MKRGLILLVLAVCVSAATALIVSQRHARRYAAQLAEQQTTWQVEKADLELALAEARDTARRMAAAQVTLALAGSSPSQPRLSPKEIVEKLKALRVSAGTSSSRTLRAAVYWLEELAQAGSDAVPAIREFLARYEDLDLDTSWFQGRSSRDQLPTDFPLPPSLRFGLFDVLRQIGGTEAEKALSEALGSTGRGVEVAYLSRLLQELSPNKYRDQALNAARALLTSTASLNSSSPLDRNHRDYLFALLTQLGDSGFAAEAQAQLVGNNQVDRGALKYLQQALGTQSVPIAAQAYQNPALTNSAGKEPLARLALSFVGADASANEFYQAAINDSLLTPSHRKNLIEDLNEDGLDFRNLTTRDLPIIENRIKLIETIAPNAMDQANAAAFQEAYKDLVNMRGKITGVPPATTRLPSQR